MRNPHIGNSRQREFLRAIDNSILTTEQILEKIGVKPAHLAMWLTTKPFRRALKNFRKRSEFISELDLARLRRFASKQLSAIAYSETFPDGHELKQRLYMEVLKATEPRRKPKRKPAPAATSSPTYHESVGAEEAEQLAHHLSAD